MTRVSLMQIHRYRYIDSDEDTFHYRFTALSIKNIYICSQFKFHLATQSSKSSISNDLHIADDFTQISRTSHPRTHTHTQTFRQRASEILFSQQNLFTNLPPGTWPDSKLRAVSKLSFGISLGKEEKWRSRMDQ